MAPRVFVARRLPVDAAAFLEGDAEVDVFEAPRPPTPDELRARAAPCRAIVSLLSDRIDDALLAACPELELIANYAVGVDNVDLAAAKARGVRVTNTPDVLTDATADLTWALLLAVARRLREGERVARSGDIGAWQPTGLLGLELAGATLGVFGFGRIGRAVARRAQGFGMLVLYTTRSPVPEAEREGAAPVSKAELLARADVLCLCAPLTPETRHAVGAPELAAMKPGAILVNTARGALVDEAALVQALDAGPLRGAGLDVFEEEPKVHPGLLERDDVVLSPHIGSATEHTRRRMAEIALGNVRAHLRGEPLLTPV